MITAADGHELIGADLSSIESRVLAWVAGEEWKLDAYRRYDATHDPRDEPYCVTACKIFGVPDGTYTKDVPGARCRQDLRSRVWLSWAAWAPGGISSLTSSVTKKSRRLQERMARDASEDRAVLVRHRSRRREGGS